MAMKIHAAFLSICFLGSSVQTIATAKEVPSGNFTHTGRILLLK
jgi:hypothetical protein